MNFHRPITAALAASAMIAAAYAADPVQPDPFELNLEDNINTPAVPPKNHASVKEHTNRLKSALDHSGFKAAYLRDGEALMITLPCDQLFRANSTTLSDEGLKLLQKLRLPGEAEGKYKILIAVHSDNTGANDYSDEITAARANAIDDVLSPLFSSSDIVTVPYGLGQDEPLVSNDSLKNRAKNRRVEIYIVPTSALFSRSGKNQR